MKPKKSNKIAIFEGGKIRRYWDEEKELWYFSIIDIIKILTGSSVPRRYWSDLKNKLKNEGSEVYEKIVQLKIVAEDGKNRETDMSDTETMFRIIQSIPSPKAEPFKLWLARVGYERIEETEDPEKATLRSLFGRFIPLRGEGENLVGVPRGGILLVVPDPLPISKHQIEWSVVCHRGIYPQQLFRLIFGQRPEPHFLSLLLDLFHSGPIIGGNQDQVFKIGGHISILWCGGFLP